MVSKQESNQPLPKWVEKISNNSKQEDVYRLFFYLMKETNLSYQDIIDMPIPAIFGVVKQLERHNKEEQKAAKRAQRKR